MYYAWERLVLASTLRIIVSASAYAEHVLRRLAMFDTKVIFF